MKFNSKYLLALIPLTITAMIVYWFSNIVSYVILAWVVSMIGAPMVTWLRRYIGKDAAAGLTLGSFVFIGGLLLYIFIPPLVNQARYLSTIDYNKVITSIEEPLNDWENWLIDKGLMPKNKDTRLATSEAPEKPFIFEKVYPADSLLQLKPKEGNIVITLRLDASDLVKANAGNQSNEEQNQDFFEKLRTNLVYYFNPSRIQYFFNATVGAFGNFLVGISSVLFISFFFLREQGLFYKMIQSLVPNEYESKSAHAIDQTSKLLIRYFTGILLQMLMVTMLVSVPLRLMSIDNALLIAFFAAILNVIPYIGPIIGALFGIVITVSSHNTGLFYGDLMPELIKVLSVFVFMQLIDNFLLQPIIFSKSVKAHPLEIFIVVLIGANLGGILGMVLAIPVYTVFRVIAKVFLSEFKVIQSLTRNI
ncbi:MAG: AI-2E family transporter [Saprospiraceae bacterium]|nr:AI-2E family transporter [Saprospiraceae bacterium]